MKKLIGIGVMLQTPAGSYLLQERDNNAEKRPGMIAPFGGGVEADEDALKCAEREMKEELDLDFKAEDLEPIKLIESHNEPGAFIQMFLLRNVDKNKLTLNEGRSIVEISAEKALENANVTDFTKQVLNLL